MTTTNVVTTDIALSDAESGSESSASSIGKKKDGLDVPMDYKNDNFGNPVEAWRQDCDPRYYRHSAEYDELSYPPKVRLVLPKFIMSIFVLCLASPAMMPRVSMSSCVGFRPSSKLVRVIPHVIPHVIHTPHHWSSLASVPLA